MPGSSPRSSPGTTELSIALLLSWSTAATAIATTAARAQASLARGTRRSRSRIGCIGRSAVNQAFDQDPVDDLQGEDREDRTEVEAAERRDDSPEDAQERFADVAQEPEDRVHRARVRRPQPHREQQPP